MAKCGTFVLGVILVIAIHASSANRCIRFENAKKGSRGSGDGGYRVFISGDPKGYTPGKIYNGKIYNGQSVSKHAFSRLVSRLTISYFSLWTVFLVGPRVNSAYVNEFTHFRVYAKAASKADKATARLTTMNPRRVGRFQLFDDPMAEFSYDCVNTLKETDSHPKTEVQFMWVAPPSGSGCVAISARVFEKSQSWYADSGQLTSIVCEGEPVQMDTTKECCACDEAKYQVRNSHYIQYTVPMIINIICLSR